jgi:hypothetical protein
MKDWLVVIGILALGIGLFGTAVYLESKEIEKCERKGGVRVKSGNASYTCIAVQKIE